MRIKHNAPAWEQRKLGELCTFTKGHGYSKSDLRDAGVPIILYGQMYTRYQIQINFVDTFVVPVDGSLCSRGTEVIVPASGETAEDIAVASAVNQPGVLFGGDINVINPDERIEQVFLAAGISNGRSHKCLAKRAQGKSVVHVRNHDIAEIEFAYPTMGEQQMISSMILNLDTLITLHQRKLIVHEIALISALRKRLQAQQEKRVSDGF